MNIGIAIPIIQVILALVVIEWGYELLKVFRERKYHREYMRDWRADKKDKELKKLRTWRKNIIIVNDNMKGVKYGLER